LKLTRPRIPWPKSSRTTKRNRINLLKQAADYVGIDSIALSSSFTVKLSPQQTVAAVPSPTQRKKLKRTGMQLAGEGNIKKLRISAALEEGLEVKATTITIADKSLPVAFITNPLRRIACEIQQLCANNNIGNHVVIVGDVGAGFFSIGVQLVGRNKPQSRHSFIPLCMHPSADDYETIIASCTVMIEAFNSVQHDSSVFKVFIGGDLKFLNAALGLKTAASLNPCPICIVKKKNCLMAVPRLNATMMCCR
jgi:hypothetical protein